ncbi:MAG: molybdopterin molybdotransferase MoeA [Chthoniobacteraceae bacterium]
MISLAEARALIAAHLRPLAAESQPLEALRGRVVNREIISPEDMPAFDRSAMDGYAVGLDDISDRFRVVGEIPAGAESSVVLKTGECARIFTGAALPAGASQVIMQEQAQRDSEWMIPTRRDRRPNIRWRGEDAKAGSVVIPAGCLVGAGELALMAQMGVVAAEVVQSPRIAHFATGHELVDPSVTAGPGQIRDSNSTLIRALCAEMNLALATQERCIDDAEQLVRRIDAANEKGFDLLLISGGASVGDHDHGARVLERLGFAPHFRRLSLKPGKPLIFATRGEQAAFVIPGNPVSHFVCFHVAIRGALERMGGREPGWPLITAQIDCEIESSSDPRELYWPASATAREGRLGVAPIAWKSSGDSTSLVGVNALIQRLPGSPSIVRGERVSCLLLRGLDS